MFLKEKCIVILWHFMTKTVHFVIWEKDQSIYQYRRKSSPLCVCTTVCLFDFIKRLPFVANLERKSALNEMSETKVSHTGIFHIYPSEGSSWSLVYRWKVKVSSCSHGADIPAYGIFLCVYWNVFSLVFLSSTDTLLVGFLSEGESISRGPTICSPWRSSTTSRMRTETKIQ